MGRRWGGLIAGLLLSVLEGPPKHYVARGGVVSGGEEGDAGRCLFLARKGMPFPKGMKFVDGAVYYLCPGEGADNDVAHAAQLLLEKLPDVKRVKTQDETGRIREYIVRPLDDGTLGITQGNRHSMLQDLLYVNGVVPEDPKHAEQVARELSEYIETLALGQAETADPKTGKRLRELAATNRRLREGRWF